MIGEVRMFAGNFAPRSWAFCEGQLLPISQNSALFSILGTIYGGDGRTTFALPDLRGRSPIGPRNGPGLSDRRLGEKGGTPTNTLNITQLPSHTHTASGTVHVSNAAGNSNSPENNYPALAAGRDSTTGSQVQVNCYANSHNASMAANSVSVTVGNTGGNQSVNNMQPYLAIYYIIAIYGVYPSRG